MFIFKFLDRRDLFTCWRQSRSFSDKEELAEDLEVIMLKVLALITLRFCSVTMHARVDKGGNPSLPSEHCDYLSAARCFNHTVFVYILLSKYFTMNVLAINGTAATADMRVGLCANIFSVEK